MINKIMFGNKVSALRKTKNISQAKLAEKLEVTTQAISKWETGQSLPEIETLLMMSRFFTTSINDLLEQNNVIFEISNKHFDIDEIAYFVPKQEKSYNKVWVEEVINGKWIERNFKEQTVNNTYYEVAKKVADHGGLVLEIGVGPGGGFMPAILNNKFDAHIIISDLSPTVVLEWKRFFDNGINPPNVSYAALDNCDLPFKDNSIDIISAGGGFGNTEGDKFKALKEIYRVLKPNGLYISGDGFVTKEHLSGYEPQIQQVLLQKRPDIFEDYYDASVTVGFKSIDNKIYGGWSTKDDESAVADLARSLGIEIIFSGYLRYCVK